MSRPDIRMGLATAGAVLITTSCQAANGPKRQSTELKKLPTTTAISLLDTPTRVLTVEPTATRTARPTATSRPPTLTPPPPTPDSLQIVLDKIAKANHGDNLSIDNQPDPLVYRVLRVAGSYYLSVLENQPVDDQRPDIGAILLNPGCLVDNLSTSQSGRGRFRLTDPSSLTGFTVEVSVPDAAVSYPILTLTHFNTADGSGFDCPRPNGRTGRLVDRLRRVPSGAGEVTGFVLHQALQGLQEGWHEGR